ncbi:MAG: putative acyltransferase [Methanocella sp. PtaU1.Bin125]|nr:MAG: putative acyltransferase [Methanocella sp. PtaU1.Bin125]
MTDCTLVDRVPDLDDYLAFRAGAGWDAIDERAARVGLARSLYSVCAYADGQLIGFGRVVGDGGCHFLIVDVIVRPDMQRQGIGSKIMGAIMAYVAAHARKGTMISLMAARGVAPFYEQFGFRARSQARPGMCIVWEG